jgi:hypothetical protein
MKKMEQNIKEENMDIKGFRMEKGWSLDTITKLSGIAKTTWIKLEKGETVRPLTQRQVEEFLKKNGYRGAKVYCVLYHKNYGSTVIDETWFDDEHKAILFCQAQAAEISPKDRANGGYCLVASDYNEESGEYKTVVYDAIKEREAWQAELERERDAEEAKV